MPHASSRKAAAINPQGEMNVPISHSSLLEPKWTDHRSSMSKVADALAVSQATLYRHLATVRETRS
jgi:hypothetical protein